MKKDVLEGLRNIGLALVAALIIVWAGSSGSPWLLFVVTPALTGLGAYLITKNDDKKTKVKATLTWASFGFLAALGWYLFL